MSNEAISVSAHGPNGPQGGPQDDGRPGAYEQPAAGQEPERDASKEAAETVLKAFGGVRGMVDMTLPGLVYIVAFNITHKVPAAAWSALALCAVFVVVRLARRETIQHAFSGVFGVAIGAWISMKTGKAEDFYLPGLLWNVGYCLALAVSALVRWPMIGLMLGPITGEMFTWRKQNPGRLAAYTKATWAWVLIMGLKPVILFPLWAAGQINLLGWLKVALGIPPLLLAMYVTWRILLTAPPPIKAELDAEDEEEPQK
ncbi:membrane protein [Kitasatospora phosalacinea]|uniref:Membrane protein n=1 Tax=Kitasatospora phosalacinea TaxID=2065 RepID=A0A9W6UT54_9ACTN|nr:membrane protein [Kitasatospora phosalacinea]